MHPILDHALPCCAALLLLLPACGAAAERSSCPQPQYSAAFTPASNDEHVVIHADRINASLGKAGVSTLSGSVHVSQKGREFSTNQVEYDDTTRQLRLDGQSLFRGPHFIIKSGSARFDLNSDSGVFTDSEFTLPTLDSHGSADKMSVSDAGHAQLDEARYTTCSPQDEAWVLTASSIHLDQESGVGTARGATLHFQGVPIFYLPWFRFPIDGRRRTGLLYPTIGQSGKTGFDLRLPLYINIAPNLDDTFTPRVMSLRGVQFINQFRYLLYRNEGSLVYQYLPHDRVTAHERSYIHLQHQGRLADSFGLDVNFAQVSDINYFDDFGGIYANSNFADASTPYLPRGGSVTWHRGNSPTTVQLLAEDYQPLAIIPNPANRPYRRLPELRLHTATRDSLYGIRAGLDGNMTNFDRSDSLEGLRTYLDPYLRWDLDRTGWYVSSRVDTSYTDYQLSNVPAGQPSSPDRTLPMLSVDGGLRFDRLTSGGMLQTVEPHLFYLFVPYDDQSDLPIFDSGEPDFNFPELFARNRYTGEDRISDANQLTGVMTTRLLNPATGLVKLAASFGVIYRFKAPKVDLPGTTLPSAGVSDYVGSVDYRFARRWDFASTVQWSPEGNQFTRGTAALRYRGAHDERLNLGYQYREGLFNQADVNFVVPVANQWHLAGRVIYSIRDSSSLAAFGGVEYETCCWAIRAGARRYISSVTGDFSTGMFLQFTLKGLTSIGKGWGNLLPTNQNSVRGVIRH